MSAALCLSSQGRVSTQRLATNYVTGSYSQTALLLRRPEQPPARHGALVPAAALGQLIRAEAGKPNCQVKRNRPAAG